MCKSWQAWAYGQNPNHIAHQLQKKCCENPDLGLPMPYFVEAPVQVKTADGFSVTTKKIGLFLPHEWFHWMCEQPHISGLEHLKSFWKEHSANDPQLENNPVKDACHVITVVFLCTFVFLRTFPVCQPSLSHLRNIGRSTSLWACMEMEGISRKMIPSDA